jgi:hypothetical protein
MMYLCIHTHSDFGNEYENNSTALEGTQIQISSRNNEGRLEKNMKQIFKCYVVWLVVLMKASCCKAGPGI